MGFLSWLGGSNDRQLAQTRYAGRESATDRAARVERKRREDQRRNHHRQAAKADREGQRWEDRRRGLRW
ncbi:hypothetical protein ACFYOF_06400 [Streptomyces sp. NPDC007148]|uniref:hypothetical protein n=1 Tax=Streptomyces sp. NPDC007148 TaxID=3364775 RepID=UPI0036A51737